MRNYNELANRTEPDYAQYKTSAENASKYIELLHHGIGLSSEGGEILDTLKKTVFYNQPLNVANLIEELGDINWYLRGFMYQLTLLDEVLIKDVDELEEFIKQKNIEKLTKRYPEQFTFDYAEQRLDKNES